MSLKNIYAQNSAQEKQASDFAESVKAALGAVSEAAYRERLNKLAEATAVGDIMAIHEDKGGVAILEKGKELIARGNSETGRMKAPTGDELKVGDNPAEGMEEMGKMAEERFALAAYLNLVNHAKVASAKSHYLAKVACPVCSGARCEVCEGAGCMSKIAAEQVVETIDSLGSLLAADQLLKQANMVQEAQGQDSVDYQALSAKLDQAQAMADSVSETLMTQSPGMGWPKAEESTEELNPVLAALGVNRVHKIKG